MAQSFFRRQSDASRRSFSPDPSTSPSAHPLHNLAPRPYSDDPSSRDHSVSSTNESRFPAPLSPPSNFYGSRPQNQRIAISIPPPITSSILIPTFNLSSSISSTQTLTSRPKGGNLASFAALTRREKALQAEIQECLDAQSTGLLRGRAPPKSHAVDPTPDPFNPPTNKLSSKSRPRSLHSARLGILHALRTLLEISQTKHTVLLSSHSSTCSTLEQITRWQRKLAEVDNKIKVLETAEPETNSIESLAKEQEAVDREIRQLEERLHDLRIRRRILARQAVEQRSTREAQCSSWVGAKREIENEVSSWLRQPLASLFIDHDLLASADAGEVEGLLEAFLALPPKRRTLSMASEWLTTAVRHIERQLEAVEREGEASERGVAVWEEVLEKVLAFEAELRTWMKKQGADGNAPPPKLLLETMRNVGKELEGHAETAEQEGWNLLVCAIGAELEAWKEGEVVLSGVLGEKSNIGSAASKPPIMEHTDVARNRKASSFNDSMGSDGNDIWGSALDTQQPETTDENRQGAQQLSKSQPGPKSRSRSPAHSIELEGLKLSGGTPTRTSAPAGAWDRRSSDVASSPSRSTHGLPVKKEAAGYRDARESEEEDDGPDPALLFSADTEGDSWGGLPGAA